MVLEICRACNAIAQLAKKAIKFGQEEALKTIQEGRGRKKLSSRKDVRRTRAMVDRQPCLTAKAMKRKMGPQVRRSRSGR